MSSTSLSWFRKGIDPGTIITLDQPPSSKWKTSQWKILEKLSEHDFQVNVEYHNDYGVPSFATTKLLCCDPNNRAKKAFMRIYLQVPHQKTEIDDADTRRRQATMITPRELRAYQDLTLKGSSITPKLLGYKIGTQDRSGLVPGGFVIWLVWEMIPGLRLGDEYGSGPFLALEHHEREQVRAAFMKAFPKLIEDGWYTAVPKAKSLVWHRETQRLYFVGRFVEAGKPKLDPDALATKSIRIFQIAEPHSTDEEWEQD